MNGYSAPDWIIPEIMLFEGFLRNKRAYFIKDFGSKILIMKMYLLYER